MTAEEILRQLNTLDEHHQLEAKRGSDIDRSFLESVCAFSNEPDLGGGWILLGAEKDEGSLFPAYTAVGVPDPDALSQKISSQCASVFNVRVRPQVRTEEVNGKPILVVHVPEAPTADKPVFFEKQGLPKGAYRRIGSTDQQCTEDDLLVFYGQRTGATYDASLVPGATLDDLDPDAVEAYRRARRRVNEAAEELSWEDDELLEALGAARRDKDVLRPTVAGVLLFGSRKALRRLFPMMRVDYIRVPGKDWVEDPDERFTTTDMRGPLIQLVQRVQDAVVDDLPRGFVLPEGEVQAETPRLSSRVLREAIVNAVMHRSYGVHSPVQVIRYANRIEVINPGFSLKAEERLGEPGSETRNPTIAAVFHETNLAETKGSGIRTMRRLMKGTGFAPPTFESDRGGNRFVARLLLHHFLSSDDLAWLSTFDALRLNDAQRRALVVLRELGAIDNSVYRQTNGVDTLAASQDLRRLREHGLIDKKGKGSATYYVPTSRFIASLHGGEDVLSTEVHQSTGVISANRHQSTGVISTESHQLSDLPVELQELVAAVGGYAPKSKLKSTIRGLCSWRAFSVGELAGLLDREAKYLRRHYLTPMVESGELAYTEPDMINHPRQAYRVTGTAAQEDDR